MKKLVLLLLAFVISITLAACNRDISDLELCLEDPTAPECQTACPEGQELVGENCLDVCATGFYREGTECIAEDPTDTRTSEEKAIDYLVDNFTGDMTFLSVAMVNMHFENAMTLTSEFDFEITEDINETHYIDATVTDSFVYDDVNGDMVKRDVFLDIDGEITLDFSIILHELPNAAGVHVYVELAPLLPVVTDGNQIASNYINWVGFDDQWAVIQLDDSLQNVIEFSVLKDMIAELFFSQMGDTFFTDVQEYQIEAMIGFDLNQYNVDLGQLVAAILAENFNGVDGVTDQINAINVDGILLHADAMYLAPHMLNLVQAKETELAGAWTQVRYDALELLLQVSTWNETTEMFDPILPIDPLKGTEAFINAMSETEFDAFIELLVKPFVEEMVYNQLNQEFNPDWLDQSMHDILITNSDFINQYWPTNDWDSTSEVSLVDSMGAVQYWNQLTEEEQGIIRWSVDHEYNGWIVDELERSHREDYEFFLRRYRYEVDEFGLQNDFVNFLNANSALFMTDYSIDVSFMISDINNYGLYSYTRIADYYEIDAALDIGNRSGNEQYKDSIHLIGDIFYRNINYFVEFENEVHELDWMINELIWVIEDNEEYLLSQYGFTAQNLIDDIRENNPLEWWFTIASEQEKQAIRDLTRDGYYNEWLIELLDEMSYRQEHLYMFLGQPEHKISLMYSEEEVLSFFYNNELWIDANTTYTTSVWIQEIMDMGIVGWYDQIDMNELAALNMIYNNIGRPYILDALLQRNQEPGMWDICFGSWRHCITETEIDERLEALLNDYSIYVWNEYSVDVDTILDDIAMYGGLRYYWEFATEQELEILEDIARQDEWQLHTLWKIEDIMKFEQGLVEFYTIHETELNAITGFDATAAIAYINTNGVQMYIDTMVTPATIELLFEEYLYDKIAGFKDAVDTMEVEEFFMELLFTDPHVTALLTEIGVNPIFDSSIIAPNMMALDFDALYLELQTFDYEALAYAMKDGQTEYDLFVVSLVDTDPLTEDFPNMQNILEVFSDGVASLEMYMAYVNDMEYAMNNLSMFDQFIDMNYYMSDIATVTPSRTEDTELLLAFEVDGLSYAQLFTDLTDQMGMYLFGFETLPFPYDDEWNCQILDCTAPDFASVIAELTTLGSLEGYILYDPNDLSWMSVNIDGTNLLDQIVSQQYADMLADNPSFTPNSENDEWTGVNNLSITITMENASGVTLPNAADTDVVNELAEDFAKFAMSMEAHDILREYDRYYEDNPSFVDEDMYNTPIYLNEIDFMRFSAAFDLEQSFIEMIVDCTTVCDPLTLDYEVTLYWIDGTLVHTNPVSYQEMNSYFLDGDLISKVAYDTIVGMVDTTNWHMMKLFTYYMWQDVETQNEYK